LASSRIIDPGQQPEIAADDTVHGMAACSITFTDGASVEIDGELQAVIDALHDVASRREHSFAVLRDADGRAIAVRPEAVVHVRPAG
jgi:hypothetical protein